ncbi:MAG TPA: phosphodiester glycosidase family protein [Candidatus Tetragenococcus pullicola]|nr:phosphodiester glycosidase family protein [Candidatus Tetragenococcus pullicola]
MVACDYQLTNIICFSFILISFDTFVLLKAFVLPETSVVVAETNAVNTSSSTSNSSSEKVAEITDTSYEDENIQLAITAQTIDDTTVHIVDITVSDPSYLKTAFDQNTYGRNIKESTSEIAENNQAILTINGDYYGFRSSGYVIRNGVLYREEATSGQEDLAIDSNGDFSIINEEEVSVQELLDSGAQQVLSFGPVLIENGEVVVDSSA